MERKETKPEASVLSNDLKVWLVGSIAETEFLWNFFDQRMYSITDSSEIKMSGEILLGDRNLFQVSLHIKSKEEFQNEPKENFEADGIIICENGLFVNSTENRIAYEDFLEWGHLKALGFLEPNACPSKYYIFSALNEEEDTEKNLEDFFKTLRFPKVKSDVRKKGIRHISGMSQEAKQIQEETKSETLQSTDMKLLKTYLTTFLTYKYILKNEKLEIELNKKEWKERFTDWVSIIKILTFNPRSDESTPEDPKKSITVILPKDTTNGDLNFSFLKAAAYFPYQLDPQGYCDFARDQDILIKLSFAAHYGYWNARYQLCRLSLRFPLLRTHPLCAEKVPRDNLHDHYYTFSLPVEYHGKSKEGEDTLPFDPKADRENIRKFFSFLAKIIQTGERPEGEEYSYKNLEYMKLKNSKKEL